MTGLGKPLWTISDLKELVGEGVVGRHTLYKLARKYGFKLGKRLVIPSGVVEALLEGRLEGFKPRAPTCPACGSKNVPIEISREDGYTSVCPRCGWEDMRR